MPCWCFECRRTAADEALRGSDRALLHRLMDVSSPSSCILLILTGVTQSGNAHLDRLHREGAMLMHQQLTDLVQMIRL